MKVYLGPYEIDPITGSYWRANLARNKAYGSISKGTMFYIWQDEKGNRHYHLTLESAKTAFDKFLIEHYNCVILSDEKAEKLKVLA